MQLYPLETLKDSVLPLCHGYENPIKSIKVTLGNSLIFRYREKVWLLTCRHLMEEVWGENMVKSVMLTRETNYFLMWKEEKNLLYHPADQERQTLDLALYYFGEADQLENESDLWDAEEAYAEQRLAENDPLKILGIRSEQMTPESVVSSNPLQVEELDAVYLKNTLSVSPEDYEGQLVNQQVAQVNKKQLMELSGGLVAAGGPGEWYPRGLITGAGTVTVQKSRDAAPQEVGIYTYTDFSYLNEMLNSVQQKG